MDEGRMRKGKVSSFYLPILEGIHRLGVSARDGRMVQPEAIMLSFAFTEGFEDFPISTVMDRIRDTFRKVRKSSRKKASTFKVKYLWVKETKYLTPSDPEYEGSLSKDEKLRYLSAASDDCPVPYPHYHMILILDGHKGTWSAVRLVMQRLVEQGVVRPGFHFSENNVTGGRTIDLRAEDGFQDYMYRASYLAKTDTKEFDNKRLWSMSQ
ncbi:hypothetical protein ACSV5M_19180 [Cellvibrio sp. ARAG 10.3]|uniref:hypothetical protein n=1 Tax=Cellvibrio sp. ARAG 10.3 TaxID=3451358 RepID=UPI003F4702C0